MSISVVTSRIKPWQIYPSYLPRYDPRAHLSIQAGSYMHSSSSVSSLSSTHRSLRCGPRLGREDTVNAELQSCVARVSRVLDSVFLAGVKAGDQQVPLRNR